MIKSFADNNSEALFHGLLAVRLPMPLQRAAARKLLILNAAGDIQDLSQPLGNRLEKLKGKRAGQYSIRINEQWRLCFEWKEGNAYSVEITDYHQ